MRDKTLRTPLHTSGNNDESVHDNNTPRDFVGKAVKSNKDVVGPMLPKKEINNRSEVSIRLDQANDT